MTHFEKHFKRLQEVCPKLEMAVSNGPPGWVITGDLDICDGNGMYWDTFAIGVFFASSYPYTVPVVYERSTIIPRELGWHMSPEGECCVDVSHRLILAARKGLRLFEYMNDKLYPYFANQLHRIHKGVYAGEEWGHHFDGIVQFYREQMQIEQPELAISLIKRVMNQNYPPPGKPCPCGSGKKLKYCHAPAIEMMKGLGHKILSQDLIEFNKLL